MTILKARILMATRGGKPIRQRPSVVEVKVVGSVNAKTAIVPKPMTRLHISIRYQ